MDPELAEVLRWGLTFLTSALVAATVARWSLRNARTLAAESASRSDAQLRAMLIGELRENLQRLGPADAVRPPQVPLIRTAWDQARGISLPTEVASAIAAGHASGSDAQALVAAVMGRLVSGGIVLNKATFKQSMDSLTEVARTYAVEAHRSFSKALELLDR